MHRAREAREHASHPLDVLVARADEPAVVVGGVGVVAVAHELEVEPVDAAAVAQHDVGDGLVVEQVLQLGVSVTSTATGTLVGPCTLPEWRNSTASSSTVVARVPGEELLQRDPRLEPRHRGAEAHVRTVPEREDARVRRA